MLSGNITLGSTFILLFYIVTECINPVCFNCHCSSYQLDSTIKCKDAITNKASYFTIWTEKVTVLVGSDVILAAEVKSHSQDYCWCTDAKLEWNGLLQNSSGRLLTVHIANATKTELGSYWAVLYLNEKFYFSDTIFLNVSGIDEVLPTDPIVVDPKIGAIVVGVLFVVIMLLGISIHCWKVQKRTILRAKQRKLEALHEFQAIRNENFDETEKHEGFTEETSESHMPLTWDLQLPANTIAESEAPLETSPAPSDAEEGSVYSKDGTSESISSEESKKQEEGGKKEEGEGEKKKKYDKKERSSSVPLIDKTEPATKQGSVPPCNIVSPISRAEGGRPSYNMSRSVTFVPIKDDRFTTERSWYRSLNNEVVSESLLINKEREARREEKKKLKALGKADNTIALGLRQYADIGAVGSIGQISQISQQSTTDPISNFLTNFKYGRSLPTPQPAGSRPTVMTIFPPTSAVRNMTYTHGGATIHTSHPDKKRHVRAIFGEQGGNSMVKTRSVQFSNSNIKSTKNTPTSSNHASTEALSKKSKSKLKYDRSKKYAVEADGSARSTSRKTDGTERKKSSSDSSLSKEVKKKKKKVQKDYTNTIEVPQLDLTPASPEKIGPRPTTNLLGNRFTVKQVESDEVDGEASSTDPKLKKDEP